MRERIRQTYTSLEIGLMQEENEQLKRRLEKAIEYKRRLLFDLNRQYLTFEKWEEILEPFEEILQGEEII